MRPFNFILSTFPNTIKRNKIKNKQFEVFAYKLKKKLPE